MGCMLDKTKITALVALTCEQGGDTRKNKHSEYIITYVVGESVNVKQGERAWGGRMKYEKG